MDYTEAFAQIENFRIYLIEEEKKYPDGTEIHPRYYKTLCIPFLRKDPDEAANHKV